MKPLLRWAGSKLRLLDVLIPRVPLRTRCYVEPFAGSAALFFGLEHVPELAHLNDINADLMECYRSVARDPDALIAAQERWPDTERSYLRMRARWNDGRERTPAAFHYLNRLSWNGLNRVNAKGENNVPIGRPIRPLDVERVREAAGRLKAATLTHTDFVLALARARGAAGAFVYLDPPYRAPGTFTRYQRHDWRESDQMRLWSECTALDRDGVPFMLSQPIELADFWDGTKPGLRVERVSVRRSISSNSKTRGDVAELLIRNY